MSVGSATGAHDEALHDVHTLSVDSAEDGVGVVAREGVAEVSYLLGETHELSHGWVHSFGEFMQVHMVIEASSVFHAHSVES